MGWPKTSDSTRPGRLPVLLAIAIVFIFIFQMQVLAQKQSRIGVIAPLSGTLASSGVAFRNAIMMADERYDSNNSVEFLFEDDGFLPARSVAIARKFIAEKVDGILIFGTPTAFAVVPITEQARLPLAAVTIVDKVVADRNYAVRHFVAWQEENRKVVEEVRRRGYRKVAVVTTVNDASLSLRDGFLRDAPVSVVLNEEFQREDMDFRAIATRIRSLKPDAVYNLLFAPQGSAFMRALRNTGCESPAFAVHNAEDPSEILAAKGAYEGVWLVTGDDRSGKWAFDAYRSRFGDAPAMGWSNAFDLAKMSIESIYRGASLLDGWKELRDFEGVFGRYGSAAGNTFDLKAIVKIIKEGRIESL